MKAYKKKGFTLIELIVSIAIFSLVLTAVYTVMDSGNTIYLNGLKKENVQSNARLAMDILSQAIRNSRVCILADSNSSFNTIDVGADGKRLLYVEGNDNSRCMYVIKNVNGKYELHKLKFNLAGLQMYRISSPLYEQRMNDTDKNIYNNPSNAQNKLTVSNISDRIVTDNLDKTYEPADSSSGNYYLLYENYGDSCYLWAKKIADGLDYKIKLEQVKDTDYTVIEDDKVADYIDKKDENTGKDGIEITADVPIDQTVSVTDQNVYKLNIYVRTKDVNKVKELNSSSYILNYRGGI